MPKGSSHDSRQEGGRQAMSIFQKRARLRKKPVLRLEHGLVNPAADLSEGWLLREANLLSWEEK